MRTRTSRFPKGHVQVMTIHQAKGLEFPVVVVGSLATYRPGAPNRVDRDLGPFYHRPPFEPEDRITLFDRMRLHYVAFSRPEKLLVLTSNEQPKGSFCLHVAGASSVALCATGISSLHSDSPPTNACPVKKTYSFTGDLKIYETCHLASTSSSGSTTSPLPVRQ